MSNTSADALQANTSSFLTSLAVNSAIAGGELAAFVVLRRWIKAIYEPRTYIPPKDEQASVLGTHLLWPLWRIIWSDPEEILQKNGVDPYMYVRFLIMMSKAMIPIWLVSWAILLPVDAANAGSSQKQGLDRFTMGNVPRNMQDRLWTHLILDILFIGWIIFLIWGEMHHWLVVRQKHLINPEHSKLPQANTVLITGIPNSYMDEFRLEQLFSHLPGGVRRVWLNRNLKEMPDLWERRAKAAQKLESAEVSMIKKARQHRAKTQTKIAKLQSKGKPIPESLTGPVNPQLLNETTKESTIRPNELEMADQLVPRKQRPTFRLKPKWAPFSLGFLGIGRKIDTIEWARKEIQDIEPKLAAAREQLQKDTISRGSEGDVYPPKSSAFILFNQQIAAHMAAQCLAHNMPYRMNRRYIEQSPDNVIWRNLGLDPYEQNVRQAISYAATGGLILAWSFPVAFIGVLSNVSTLTETFHWLSWIQGDSFGKKLLQGVISGILPPVLLALLMMLLPFILRQLAAFEGIPSKTEVELSLMTRYFIFLVVHTFVVVTLTSGLVSAVKPIAENPASVANILAKQMPTASTFFITLILTQFTGLAGTLLQVVHLVLYYVKVILLGGSPRSVYSTRYKLPTGDWGTDFPGTTVYVVIMIGYCVISPIINGFAAAFFVMSAIVYKYLWIWVFDQPAESDTGGLFFPKAINHVFVGIYIQQVSLCALFFLARDANLKVAALPQGIIMIVFIVLTAGVHYVLMASYQPLRHSLPLTLAHLSYGMPKEDGHEGSVIGQYTEDNHDEAVQATLTMPPEDLSKVEKIINRRKNTFDNMRDKLEQVAPGNGNGKTDEKGKLSGAHTPRETSRLPSPFQTNVETLPSTPPQPDHDQVYGGWSTSPGPPVGSTHSIAPIAAHDFARDSQSDQHSGYNANGIMFDSPSASIVELNTFGRAPDAEQQAETEEEVYFALPGEAGVEEKRQIDPDDPTAFFHPATKEPMRILWLPKDELGLCDAEIEANQKLGITATSQKAILTSKGNVRIFGRPPDDF